MEVGIPLEVGTVVHWQYTSCTHEKVALNFFNSSGDILLHVNPRYDQGVLVLNSQLCSSWGQEERPSGFPLHSGCEAHVVVVAEHDGYVIYANGRNFYYTYRHRRPMQEVTVIRCTIGKMEVGRVSMADSFTSLRMRTSPSTPYA